MPQPSPGHPALALRLLRAAGSLAALALLLAGVPWTLAAAGTLPGGVPSGGDIGDALMSPDDGHVLMTVLTLVAWALWAWFALGVAAELAHLLYRRPARRRRRAHRRPVLGAPQRLAGFLLGGLLILPAGSAMAAPAPATAATAPLQPAAPTGDAGRSAPAAPAAAEGPVHVVGETGETVWDLAVEYLGSGSRAHEIRTLNPTLPDTTLLPAGLAVQLPADARTPPPPTPAEVPEVSAPQVQLAADEQPSSTTAEHKKPDVDERQRTHTVKAGESLSSIAEDETGDAARWPQLYAASKDTDQPGRTPRLSDPDLIYPGQQITIPAAYAPKAPHGERNEQPERPGDAPGDKEKDTPPRQDTGQGQGTGNGRDGRKDRGGPVGGADKPAQSAKPTPSPKPTPPPAPDRTDRHPTAPPSDRDTSAATPSTPASPAPSTPAPAPDPGAGESSSLLNTRTIGVLASLAAAVTLALSVRRILQRRRAKPGELIAMPEETSPTEARMAQAAEPDGPLRLDRALRTLAAHTTRAGEPLPELRGARLTDHGVQVLPEDLHANPVPPFTTAAGGWWVCEETAELLDEQDAAQVDAPYPEMVTIGADASGRLVLLNLPQAGVLLLNGERHQVEEVLTSLALEAGMSPWATQTEVVVVGFGEGLNHLLPTSALAYMRESSHAARDFAERLLEAHQEREEARPPYLILCAAELTADSAWQIAETFDKATDVMQVALIAPASSAELLFEQHEVLDAGSSRPQRLDILGTDIILQRLERESVEEITAALAVSGQDAHPAEGAWQHVPSESQTAHAARTTAASRQPEPDEAPQAVRIPASASGAPAAAPAAGREEGASAAASGEELGVFPALLTASPSPAAISLPIPPAAPPAADPGPAPDAEEEAAAPSPRPGPKAAPAQPGTPGLTPDAAPRVPGADGEPGVPFIRVLGPVTIAGVSASRHGTREAQLAALLHLKPGRSADSLCTDMDPATPWTIDTLNARMGGLRRSLGQDNDGNSYVPRRAVKSDPYELSPKICCDWHDFLKFVEAALPHGPDGLTELETALEQVRGRPFGTQPLPWSQPLQQEMAMRIVSVAHTVATYRLSPGPHHDLTLARRATATGLEADETSEILYRDWMIIENAAGNRSGLNAAISRLEQANRTLGLPMDIETEQLMHQLQSDE